MPSRPPEHAQSAQELQRQEAHSTAQARPRSHKRLSCLPELQVQHNMTPQPAPAASQLVQAYLPGIIQVPCLCGRRAPVARCCAPLWVQGTLGLGYIVQEGDTVKEGELPGHTPHTQVVSNCDCWQQCIQLP